MKQDSDIAYFRRRAEQEIGMAQRAEDPRAVAVHYRLAELYLERIGPEPASAGA